MPKQEESRTEVNPYEQFTEAVELTDCKLDSKPEVIRQDIVDLMQYIQEKVIDHPLIKF